MSPRPNSSQAAPPPVADPMLTAFGLDDAALEHEPEQWLQWVRQAERAEPLCRLGRFELLTEISRGGQGIVYRARDLSSGRTVAVKRLLHGPLASAASEMRLERELQAVSALKHAGIVAALGLDIAEGQSVLAMEWIDGVSITRWASGGIDDSNKPKSAREIVAMLRAVCHALQHAHQRGVIHRDLKPSNILVDANNQPHILDFGVAKIVSENFTPGGLSHAEAKAGANAGFFEPLTIGDQFIGTPAYAAPEQLAGQADQIGLRSDVYSLGVIAYEMLTGRKPYPQSDSAAETLRLLEDADVKRPSLFDSGIDHDLDLIILKAFVREPEQRYQSVDALDSDLARWQCGAPILARGPGTLYLLRKLLRRHRVGVAFSITIALLVLVGGIVATVLAARLEHARQQEHESRVAAEQINTFLHDFLAASDPVSNPNTEITAAQLLDRAAARLDESTELEGQPRVRAALLHTIGYSYMNLGKFELAERLLTEALALRERHQRAPDPELIESLSALVTLRYHQHRFPEAEPLAVQSLETSRAAFGPKHKVVARELNNLAAIRRAQNNLESAEALLREAIEMRISLLGPDHPDVAESLNNLGNVLRMRGDLAGAEQLCRQALEIRRRHFGDRHLLVAQSLSNIGVLLGSQGRIAESTDLLGESLDVMRDVLGPDHFSVGTTAGNLGQMLYSAAKFETAEPLLREAVRIRMAIARDDERTVALRVFLARCLAKLDRADEALALMRDLHRDLTTRAGADHSWLKDIEQFIAELEAVRRE